MTGETGVSKLLLTLDGRTMFVSIAPSLLKILGPSSEEKEKYINQKSTRSYISFRMIHEQTIIQKFLAHPFHATTTTSKASGLKILEFNLFCQCNRDASHKAACPYGHWPSGTNSPLLCCHRSVSHCWLYWREQASV